MTAITHVGSIRGTLKGCVLDRSAQRGRITYDAHPNATRERSFMSRKSRLGARDSRREDLPDVWPMNPFEPTSTFNQALALHKAGDLIAAEKLYGQVLKLKPDHFDSLNLLGIVCLQRSNYTEALQTIDMALKAEPKLCVCPQQPWQCVEGVETIR